jgi:transposase-like protein
MNTSRLATPSELPSFFFPSRISDNFPIRITPEEAEIKRVKKDLEEVKEERDILKKALAFFSRQSK